MPLTCQAAFDHGSLKEQKVARWLLRRKTQYIYFSRNGSAPRSSRPKLNDVKNQKHISLTPILELSLNAFGGFRRAL